MTETEVLDRLTHVFRNIFDDNQLEATRTMTAKDVKRWDSLSHIDMIMLVEEEFGLRLPTRQVTGLKNVGELVDLIMAKK